MNQLCADYESWAFWRARGSRDAEDNAIIALRQAAADYDETKCGSFKTFLSHLIMCRASDSQRKGKRLREITQSLPERFDPADRNASDQLRRFELKDELEWALSRLSDLEQWILRKFYVEGYSYEEIAVILNRR